MTNKEPGLELWPRLWLSGGGAMGGAGWAAAGNPPFVSGSAAQWLWPELAVVWLTEMASPAVSVAAAAAAAAASTSELLRHLAAELRLLAAQVRVGEPCEPPEEFDRERFWRRFNEAAVTVAREATTLTMVSRLPLPSPQETQGICEQVHAAIQAITAVYYALPKDQGITLRKLVRGTTLDIVDGMAQLVEILLLTPTQSPENSDLISCNSVWDACQQIPKIPRDNKAAALLMLTKSVDFVKDAHEEMEQAVEECDPYSGLLHDSAEDCSDSLGGEDEVLGFLSSQDVHWSEEDQELIAPCLALVRASKACLKKIRILVAEKGKKDQVAHLDDIVDISEEISPSVDDLALSIYPPVCHLTVRINSAKLVSVLRKALEVTEASHVTPQPEDSWIPLFINAVDHCMNRIKELTQSEIDL